MPSTNKTTNYELSQFVNTDVPSWLGDYNGDMLKIDTAIKGVGDNANNALELSNTANQTATNLSGDVQSNTNRIDGFNPVKHTAYRSTNIADPSAVSFNCTITGTQNRLLTQISIEGSMKWLEQNTGVIVRGGTYYVPIAECEGNLFNALNGDMSSFNNVVYCGNGSLHIVSEVSPGRAGNVIRVFAIFNGTRTILYGEFNQSFFVPGNVLIVESTVLFSGTYY